MWRWEFLDSDVDKCWLELWAIWSSKEFRQFLASSSAVGTTEVANGCKEVGLTTESATGRDELILETNHRGTKVGVPGWPTALTNWG